MAPVNASSGLALELLQPVHRRETGRGAARALRNEGSIGWPLSSKRNSAKSPVLARSRGRTPMIWTSFVIDSLPTWNLRMPGVSMVGAMATMSSPASSCTRAMTSSEL